MLPVLTRAQMRASDERLMHQVGISGAVLMENAARGALFAMKDWLEGKPQSRILLFCGTGNNGGDGLALARLLMERGNIPFVLLVGDSEHLSTDARVQYDILLKILPKHRLKRFVSDSDIPQFVRQPDILIDALLGTGASGELRSPILEAVASLNALAIASNAHVLALDIPTGLDADTGIFANNEEGTPLAVCAARTITMGAYKIGFVQHDANRVTGEVCIAPLGSPITLEEIDPSERTILIEPADIPKAYPRRNNTASKFDFGRVTCVTGSKGMTGAAILGSTAALKSGAGLVTSIVPESERHIIAQSMPELMTASYTNPITGFAEIEQELNRSTVVLIGSGMRGTEGEEGLLVSILRETDKPIVADAGALIAVASEIGILRERTQPTIITPHSGEMAKLLGITWQQVDERRMECAREFAIRFRVTVVMKGAPTYIADPSGTVFVNSTGNVGLATAGSGDVLGGMIAGIFAQMKEEATQAAIIGVYLHGLAADIAVCDLTTIAMTAGDIIRYLPAAYKALELA
jgi:hydroxyethylthiazole kinase-like uncharacterized protein yjeF